ncbi:MAG: helix-turn-helix domain-containing protein, partial [Firmicutes bacterium]|nr:helix-turn-helix domain-containing protein [Bacillota bacterium]
MKLADKIIYYRTRLSMSQEELAYKIGVSRQSVSKWEMDQADPRIDKIVQMCALFGVTADELIR